MLIYHLLPRYVDSTRPYSQSSPWLLSVKEANAQKCAMISVLAWICGWSTVVRNWYEDISCCEVNKFLSPWASFTNVYFRLASLGNTENTPTLPRGQFLIVLCNLPVLLLFQGHQYRCHIARPAGHHWLIVSWYYSIAVDGSFLGDASGNKTKSTALTMQHKRSRNLWKWLVLKSGWSWFSINCTSQTWDVCTACIWTELC